MSASLWTVAAPAAEEALLVEPVPRDPLLVRHVKTDKHAAGVGGVTAREVRRHFWLLKADEAGRELPGIFLTAGRGEAVSWRAW